MSFSKRTHNCGELNLKHLGQKITLNGWVHRIRDLGGVFFIDLRDRKGVTQLMFKPSLFSELTDIRLESCLSVTGTIIERSTENKNSKIATGDIELAVESYSVLSTSTVLPFPINDEEQMVHVNEELRIKYRYLDLRRSKNHRILQIRAGVVRKIREFLNHKDFIEVETPIFTRSTPEGARDYLVPYRLEPGLFYALPQSPQQYKQLLMVGGIERYYQIAKCFRDESQRSDRQPEFTQLDLEMSFVDQEDILGLAEELTLKVVNETIQEFGLEKDLIQGFTRLTYDQAIEFYGTDKPDLRFGLPIFDLSEIVKGCGFGVFESVLENKGTIRGLRYPSGSDLSRKEISQLEEFCKQFGAKGMAYLIIEKDGTYKGPVSKFLTPEILQQIVDFSNAEKGDMLCFIADQYSLGNNVLSRLRNKIGENCKLINSRKLHFCWVLDFPLVEWDEEAQRWNSVHHPFTAPKTEDLVYLETDPSKIRSQCYDIVCNGTEWASGSIRIHQADLQSKIFDLLGIDKETQRERFGHILEAFQFGPPPHGGVAPGIDRLIMFLTDEENIREVMAFPKIGQGHDPLMGAPSTIDEEQWKEIGLKKENNRSLA